MLSKSKMWNFSKREILVGDPCYIVLLLTIYYIFCDYHSPPNYVIRSTPSSVVDICRKMISNTIFGNWAQGHDLPISPFDVIFSWTMNRDTALPLSKHVEKNCDLAGWSESFKEKIDVYGMTSREKNVSVWVLPKKITLHIKKPAFYLVDSLF